MNKHNFRTVIRLYSDYEGLPGGGSHENLLFRRGKNAYQILLISDFGVEFEIEHPLSSHKCPNWRLLADFLVQERWHDGLASSEELPEIIVVGLRSWRSEVLALCWARWDENWPERNEAIQEFLELAEPCQKSIIESFWGERRRTFGNDRPACCVARWLEWFVTHRENDPKYRSLSLGNAVERFEVRKDKNPLVSVVRAFRHEWREFEKVVHTHERAIQHLVESRATNLRTPETWEEAMSRPRELSRIKEEIIETLRIQGRLPDA